MTERVSEIYGSSDWSLRGDGGELAMTAAGTPEYLLRGYFRMLTATGDTARMMARAADPAWQDRMLDLSSGDSHTRRDSIHNGRYG